MQMRILCALVALCTGAALVRADTIYSNTLDTPAVVAPGVTAVIGGSWSIATIGSTSQGFSGKVLRDITTNAITLSLTGLPQHTEVSLSFVLAVIDHWGGNGTGTGAPDFFDVKLDGNLLLQASYNNISLNGSDQAPAGTAIVRGVSLTSAGATGLVDSVYDLAGVAALQHIAHTASSLVFTFTGDGRGWNPSSTTESFALDDIKVEIADVQPPPPTTGAPVPASLWGGLVLMAVAGLRRTLPRLATARVTGGKQA